MIGMAMLMTCRVEKYEKILAKETYINEKRPIKETYVYAKKPLNETYIKYKKRVNIPEMVSASEIDELRFCVDIGCCHYIPTTYEYV